MIVIRIRRQVILFTLLFITLLSICVFTIDICEPSHLLLIFSRNEDIVNSEIEFKVKYIIEEMDGLPGHLPISDKSYVPVRNARIILIDDRTGEIIKSGLTDEKGIWKSNVIVGRDPRFKEKNMGTVTVITVADGYNESIHFNVPVNEYDTLMSSHTIILNPIRLERRNEPSFRNADFHRFTVFQMLDHYAEEFGLKRQPVVQEYQVPPWSPNLER